MSCFRTILAVLLLAGQPSQPTSAIYPQVIADQHGGVRPPTGG